MSKGNEIIHSNLMLTNMNAAKTVRLLWLNIVFRNSQISM